MTAKTQVGAWVQDLGSCEDKTPGGGAASAMCGALAASAAAFAASVSGKSKRAKNSEDLKVFLLLLSHATARVAVSA